MTETHKRYVSGSERAKEIARGAFLWATVQHAIFPNADALTAWEAWKQDWPDLSGEAQWFQAAMFERALNL